MNGSGILKTRILYLVVMVVTLPLLAESIYAPGLPSLASSFGVSDTLAEMTLSVYLLGLSVGVLFWGNLSDLIGRKAVILIGFSVFTLATIGCYCASDFWVFLFLRFGQAFGGSVSCVTQSINRDVFLQSERMALSAKIGTAVSIAPAVGAMLGGVITRWAHWRDAFLFLLIMAVIYLVVFSIALPETRKATQKSNDTSSLQSFLRVLQDNNLTLNAVIIGLGLGVLYAFMSEGAFYCIDGLGMQAEHYGLLCAASSFVYAMGCRRCSYVVSRGVAYQYVMKVGVGLMFVAFFIMLLCINAGGIYFPAMSSATDMISQRLSIGLFAVLWVVSSLGLSFILTPCFANALENQSQNAGMAASLFAFIYNIISAMVNLEFSLSHTEGMFVMPLTFLVIVLIIGVACEILFRGQRVQQEAVSSSSSVMHAPGS